MAALPPITLDVFQTQIETGASTVEDEVEDEVDGSPQSSSDESDTPSDIDEMAQPLSPSHCLLCGIDSFTLEQNVSHMQHSHGFHIPEKRYLTDLESFIGYLGVLVLQYHECLYCGSTKRSVQGIRQHMLAKGHCMVNLSPDSELLDFYEFDRSDEKEEENDDGNGMKKTLKKPMKLSATELQLPSGAIVPARLSNHIVSGKRHHSSGKRSKQKVVPEITEGRSHEQHEQPRRSRDQRVAVRGEMGMLGIPEQQKRALRVVEKKMLKQEMVAKAHQRWAVEKVANRQKNFKVCAFETGMPEIVFYSRVNSQTFQARRTDDCGMNGYVYDLWTGRQVREDKNHKKKEDAKYTEFVTM